MLSVYQTDALLAENKFDLQEISLFTAVYRDSAKYIELTALHFINCKQPRYVIYITPTCLVKQLLQFAVRYFNYFVACLKNIKSDLSSKESIMRILYSV